MRKAREATTQIAELNFQALTDVAVLVSASDVNRPGDKHTMALGI
jgi:hypothetical protein